MNSLKIGDEVKDAEVVIRENPGFGNLQVSQQEQESGGDSTTQRTRTRASGSGAGGTLVSEVEVRGLEGKETKIGEVEELPQLRWRGPGHRRRPAVADDPVPERLPGRQVRGRFGTCKESQHPRPKVQGTESGSRSRRRRKRRRCPKLLGSLS